MQPPEFVHALVLKAIRRSVADAIRSGTIVSASDCADRILETYPTCGLSKRQLADEVMVAAAKAGVPVEFGSSTRMGLSADRTGREAG